MANENLRTRAGTYAASSRSGFSPFKGLQPAAGTTPDAYYRPDISSQLTASEGRFLTLAKTFSGLSPTLSRMVDVQFKGAVAGEQSAVASAVAGLDPRETSQKEWSTLVKEHSELASTSPWSKVFFDEEKGKARVLLYQNDLEEARAELENPDGETDLETVFAGLRAEYLEGGSVWTKQKFIAGASAVEDSFRRQVSAVKNERVLQEQDRIFVNGVATLTTDALAGEPGIPKEEFLALLGEYSTLTGDPGTARKLALDAFEFASIAFIEAGGSQGDAGTRLGLLFASLEELEGKSGPLFTKTEMTELELSVQQTLDQKEGADSRIIAKYKDPINDLVVKTLGKSDEEARALFETQLKTWWAKEGQPDGDTSYELRGLMKMRQKMKEEDSISSPIWNDITAEIERGEFTETNIFESGYSIQLQRELQEIWHTRAPAGLARAHVSSQFFDELLKSRLGFGEKNLSYFSVWAERARNHVATFIQDKIVSNTEDVTNSALLARDGVSWTNEALEGFDEPVLDQDGGRVAPGSSQHVPPAHIPIDELPPTEQVKRQAVEAETTEVEKGRTQTALQLFEPFLESSGFPRTLNALPPVQRVLSFLQQPSGLSLGGWFDRNRAHDAQPAENMDPGAIAAAYILHKDTSEVGGREKSEVYQEGVGPLRKNQKALTKALVEAVPLITEMVGRLNRGKQVSGPKYTTAVEVYRMAGGGRDGGRGGLSIEELESGELKTLGGTVTVPQELFLPTKWPMVDSWEELERMKPEGWQKILEALHPDIQARLKLEAEAFSREPWEELEQKQGNLLMLLLMRPLT